MARKLFSKEELHRIEKSVKEAEAASGGEIVPVFARHSSFYEMALWRGGCLFSLLISVILLVYNEITDVLLFLPPYLWVLVVFSSGLIGAVLVMQLPFLKRWLIGKKIMKARVEDQAQNMFYQHNISLTEQRTGILLYISFFEKMAVILPDIGIGEVVPEEEWKKVMRDLMEHLKRGKIVEGIAAAIQACGNLLDNSHIQVADDEGNELPDEVRFKE